ncbi:endonuclease/exonuclease/phosphatase family protein [Tetraselmis virus 1]|uniref:Endonuclease/exonuclease/phosphatase family protein n=1 Tax=Tetraselmis virus 1 TaxID=2060617 RepID=A0A2P0VNW6_9VIRU|nr:endonuclease/exonuclease/phosphatase family protein [Tetraselmis virus 1]AUF82591.1 endonuclease/exonuclease/phosphatase family protein [Tetraselmis virus 1]
MRLSSDEKRARSKNIRQTMQSDDRNINYNRKSTWLDPYEYTKHTSPDLEKLLNKIKDQGCVKYSDTLYGKTKALKDKNGWNLRVLPKGSIFYKAFPGFITEKQLREYAEKNKMLPSWFGNEVVCLAFSASYWGGIVAFESTKELRLIDWFNEQNMARLLGIMKKMNMNEEVDMLKINSGFRMPLLDQVNKLSDLYEEWKSIWLYTREVTPEFNIGECDPIEAKNFNPVVVSKTTFVIDKKWWTRIMPKMDNIDGVIRRTILSSIEETGTLYEEEMILKSGLYNNGIKIDETNKYYWKNWKIKGMSNVNYKGTMLRIRINRITEPKQSANEYFTLIKYVSKNKKCVPASVKLKGLLSYNTHNLYPVDMEKSTDDAIEWLKKSIKGCPRAEAITLQEVPLKSIERITELLQQNNYNSIKYTETTSDIFLCLALKEKNIRLNEIKIRQRTHIISETGICAVHLDIGKRLIKGESNKIKIKNNELKNSNSRLRILTLKEILNHDPKILFGDFNFVPSDKEDKYLNSKGYTRLTPDVPNTTPHNRVDHVYIKGVINKDRFESMVFPSPVSDHGMIFQQTSGLKI